MSIRTIKITKKPINSNVVIHRSSKDGNKKSTKNSHENHTNTFKDNNLDEIYFKIKEIMNAAVDTSSFMISINPNFKKKDVGVISATIKITNNKNNRFRVLLLVINKDNKYGNINVLVIDNNYDNPSVLFSNISKDPIDSINKYIPTILKSTQNMIKI